MSILTSNELVDALAFNKGRTNLLDAKLIFRIRESLDLPGAGRIDADLVEAVAAWQVLMDLTVDGKIGPKTERSLRRVLSGAPSTIHPLPPTTRRWGFDHAELKPFPYKDSQLEAITATGTWAAGMIRLVSNFRPGAGTFNRGLDSFTTLDTYSIGIAHWWSDSAPELLANIAQLAPDVAAWAWGEETAKRLEDEDWLLDQHPPTRGKHLLSDELKWLLSGWWACARHPAVARIQCEMWLDEYICRARRVAQQLGWASELDKDDGGRILAALTRAANSGRGVRHIRPFVRNTTAMDALERFYRTDRDAKPRGYNKPERWEKIQGWENFSGAAPGGDGVLVDGLNFAVTAKRHDGSEVLFPDELS